MAIFVPAPVVTGGGLKVTLRNDGDRPGNLYGALLSFQSDKTDRKTETVVQLLSSELIQGMLVNPGPATFFSLPFADVWDGATNLMGVFFSRVLDAQSAIDHEQARCSLILLFLGPVKPDAVKKDVRCIDLLHVALASRG